MLYKTIQEIEEVIFNMNFFNNWKLHYGLSMPVIRHQNRQNYVAYYVIRNGLETILTGKCNRPEYWILFNTEDGKCELKDCRTEDFLEGFDDFEVLFDLISDSSLNNAEIEMKWLDMFNEFLATDFINKPYTSSHYRMYLNHLKSYVGVEFATFYDFLSS